MHKKCRVRDVGRVVTGKTPATVIQENFGNDFPFLTPTDMHGSKWARTTERGLSRAGASTLRGQIPAGSVAVSCIGWQMGKAILIDRPTYTNQQINSIIPHGDVDAEYLYYYFATRRNELLSIGAAGGVRTPIISKSLFEGIEIELPEYQVQRRIANILSSYDDLIENNTRRISVLEEMARRLYEEWFVRFRFPGHEGVPMVDSELGLVPQGWHISPITKIAVVKYGKGLPTKHLADDSPFPVYGASKVIGYYTEYTREARTLIVGCRGSVGVPQITLPRCFVTNNSFTVDPNNPNGLLWLFLAILSRGLKDVIGGSAQPQITLEGLAGTTFIAPTDTVIEMFDLLVRPIYELVWNLADKNTNLRTTRDLLLPKLISGELDVSTLLEPEAIAT